MMRRRRMLALMGSTAVLATGFLAGLKAEGEAFAIMRSEAEWRGLLTPEQFAVLRCEATERAASSVLN